MGAIWEPHWSHAGRFMVKRWATNSTIVEIMHICTLLPILSMSNPRKGLVPAEIKSGILVRLGATVFE